MAKISPLLARSILSSCKINMHVDFHALSSDKVDALLTHADAYKYRKPKNANGSRARYFHAYLCRVAQRDEE